MIRDVAASLGNTFWPSVALILFFLVFIGIVTWTYRGRRDRFNYESRLPLDEAEKPDRISVNRPNEPELDGHRS